MLMLFASLLAIPLALNILASRDDFARFVDPMIAAVMLCLIWAFVTAVAQIYPFPESKKFHSLVDLAGLCAMTTMLMTRFAWWKLVVAALFAMQLWAHYWFWDNWSAGVNIGRRYVMALNVLWLAQLVCVSLPGGTYAASRLVARLRAPRHVRPLARR